jgi:hypothetical protein
MMLHVYSLDLILDLKGAGITIASFVMFFLGFIFGDMGCYAGGLYGPCYICVTDVWKRLMTCEHFIYESVSKSFWTELIK